MTEYDRLKTAVTLPSTLHELLHTSYMRLGILFMS